MFQQDVTFDCKKRKPMKHVRRIVLLALLGFLCLTLAHTQTTTPVISTVTGASVPDAAAQQAVFSVHAAFDNAANAAAALYQQQRIGLSSADLTMYQASMQVHYAAGRTSTSATTTYANLMATLSPAGQELLNTFIQAEKIHMHTVVQQPVQQ